MNILMLGHGFVGGYIKETFDASDNINLTVLTKTRDRYDQPFFLLKAINKHSPDIVINACGYTGRPNVDACEINKQTCWDLNVNIPVNVSTICETYGIPFIHISSGCIYTGYSKHYTEEDKPNFGMGSDESSWYSKTKHACEIALKNTNTHILRMRMPFSRHHHDRNFLCKILKYDNLIEFENSMTSVEDFVQFLYQFSHKIVMNAVSPGIYNVCNPGTCTIRDITNKFKTNGVGNGNWEFVDISKLDIKAGRSNCILSTDKIASIGLQLPDIHTSISNAINNVSEQVLLDIESRAKY